MILMLLIVLLFASPALAVDYYVSPSGSGTTCSTGTPCSLNTGMNTAVSGDRVILKNGTYTTDIDTKADGVTIEAENRHLAIIQKDGTGSWRHLSVEHNNITLRGIRFDGINYITGGEARGNYCRFGGYWRGIVTSGLLIEDNIFENSPNTGIGIHGLRDSVFRFNQIDDTGYRAAGEGFYIGEAGGSQPIVNIEIYGHTIKNYTQQCIDVKEGSGPVYFHHNICEDQAYKSQLTKSTTEGAITARTIQNRINDNIVRNGVNGPSNSSGNGLIDLTGDGGNGGGDIAEDNVIYNMSGHSPLWSCNKTGAGPNSIIRNNTVCNSSPYTTESGCTGLTVTGNTTGAAQSVCDAEVTRILAEITQLPGYPDAGTPECNDSVDNDGDGDTDYPADAGCTSAQDNSEIGPLVAHWTFDDVGTDSSGNSISVSLQNGATYAAGQVNNALSLDGINDYATASTNTKLEIGPALSIMGWVKTSATSIHDIYSKWVSSTSGYRLLMGVDSDGNTTAGILALDVITPSATGAERYVGSATTINDGNWHHVAATTINGNTKIYIDGQESTNETQETIIIPTGAEARVGARTDGQRFWNGQIDELKIYNVALSAADVLADYNAGLGGSIGLSFTDVTGQAVSTVVSSNTAVITPANGTAISISESCTPACTAQYQIYQGDCSTIEHAWTAVAGTVDNGECVGLRLTTSAQQGTTNAATITVGSFMDTWQVTTVQTPPDPDLFPASSKASGGATFSGGATID